MICGDWRVATARRAVHDAEREYRIVARVAPISGSHARYQRGSADALAAARETYRRARIEAGL